MPDNRVGHGPSSDAVRATRQCYPGESAALTASYGICPTDLTWAMDERANLSCLRVQRSDKVMFSGGAIRARPGGTFRLGKDSQRTRWQMTTEKIRWNDRLASLGQESKYDCPPLRSRFPWGYPLGLLGMPLCVPCLVPRIEKNS